MHDLMRGILVRHVSLARLNSILIVIYGLAVWICDMQSGWESSIAGERRTDRKTKRGKSFVRAEWARRGGGELQMVCLRFVYSVKVF